MFELSEIKQIRKKLGLTQTELAQKAGVSQSLVAKIESGKLEPAYSRAKKIFDTLDMLSRKQSLKAGDIMNRKVISAPSSALIQDAVRKMRKFGISQIPVTDGDRVVGLVTESLLLDRIVKDGPDGRVGDVMEEAPPIVSEKAGIDAVTGLLRHFPMVLVMEKGKVRGLVTKSDILGRYIK